jgi:Mlc titration factor MtfA (ptsG expression regulator)
MPQDSTYILNSLDDTASLPDSLRQQFRETTEAVDKITKISPAINTSNQQFPFRYLTISLVAACIYVLLKYWRYRYLTHKLDVQYSEKKDRYDGILTHYNPYYRSLNTQARDRFIKRIILFIESKEFEYVDMDMEEEMPVLVSAAAVQLTFGLKDFLLDYFNKIFILKNQYRYMFATAPYEGNVSPEGIYLSWSDFQREYGDYTDGENVGLHEMAHALVYVNFTVEDGEDESFRKKFYDFSPIGRPIFEKMQAGETNLLDKYAATNFEEFWAVCIETFFEKPVPFREQMPDLYFSLCGLLNQDPTTAGKILLSLS